MDIKTYQETQIMAYAHNLGVRGLPFSPLLDISGIAELMGLSPSAVKNSIITSSDFPQRVYLKTSNGSLLKKGAVWQIDAVLNYFYQKQL